MASKKVPAKYLGRCLPTIDQKLYGVFTMYFHSNSYLTRRACLVSEKCMYVYLLFCTDPLEQMIKAAHIQEPRKCVSHHFESGRDPYLVSENKEQPRIFAN